ncbi:hypothetical protein TELCIR_24488, partial [Teladorsagia circumcincta]
VIFADGIAPDAVWGRMLFGFDWAVWVTIAISAFGGLVVAVVIKFADNILKEVIPLTVSRSVGLTPSALCPSL